MSEEKSLSLPVLPEDGFDRREVLQLIGASLAWAACEPNRGQIVPYTRAPRELVPGRPQVYATTLVERGIGLGLLVGSHSGRPIKVDGNPDHPTTLGGGSSPSLQASIFDLYDPARGQQMRKERGGGGWSTLLDAFRKVPDRGRGVHFLLEPTSSPLLIQQIQTIRTSHPEARFHFFDPLRPVGEEGSMRRAFGRVLSPRLDFERAVAIASFDSDFLTDPPQRIRYAFDFSKGRRVRAPTDRMSRLWVAEGELTITGALADERLRARPSEIPGLLLALVSELGRGAGRGGQPGGAGESPPWIRRLAKDLLAQRGSSLVVVGERQPEEAHLAGLLANQILGNLGTTLVHTDAVIFEAGGESHDLVPLAKALEAGEVDTLLILGGNPAHTAPLDLRFRENLSKARQSIYVGLHQNQTASICSWYLPSTHFLETWGDIRGHDGTVSLIQPLIRPLLGGRSHAEILAAFSGNPRPDAETLLRDLYRDVSSRDWQTALQWGFFQGALPPSPVQPNPDELNRGVAALAQARPAQGVEISIRPDPYLKDGSHSYNTWLVELPHPITRMVWQNAALLSPATMKRLELEDGQLLDIQEAGGKIRIPVMEVAGMADDLLSLHLGWGQPSPVWAGGRAVPVGKIVGTDVYPLRTTATPWILPGARLEKVAAASLPFTAERMLHQELVLVHQEKELHGRPVLLSTTMGEWRKTPNFVTPHDLPSPDLYGAPWNYSGQQWGMSIDLNTCIGCNACVVACQAENNTPSVGEVNAKKGRLMHWLRIDRYYLARQDDAVQYLPQPMMCQHCERAPCEYVCPVNATVHSPDGLNEMVYNRCIGTRFCSNNCPYKVRRFNFFRYNHHLEPETIKMQQNPNVTVRERGVMEKCTYCVQRIRMTEIDARVEGRAIRDGEVKTACQVACPTHAIIFGNIGDPESEVSRLRKLQHSYAVLNHDLGTEPRTRYIAHIRNQGEEEA